MSERAEALADHAAQLHEQIAALTAERDRLADALIECYDAAIPQAMPWMGSHAEKAEYALTTLPGHLRGLNRLSVHHAAERDQLRAALKAVEWAAELGDDHGHYRPACYRCRRFQSEGHSPNCIAGLALKGKG